MVLTRSSYKRQESVNQLKESPKDKIPTPRLLKARRKVINILKKTGTGIASTTGTILKGTIPVVSKPAACYSLYDLIGTKLSWIKHSRFQRTNIRRIFNEKGLMTIVKDILDGSSDQMQQIVSEFSDLRNVQMKSGYLKSVLQVPGVLKSVATSLMVLPALTSFGQDIKRNISNIRNLNRKDAKLRGIEWAQIAFKGLNIFQRIGLMILLVSAYVPELTVLGTTGQQQLQGIYIGWMYTQWFMEGVVEYFMKKYWVLDSNNSKIKEHVKHGALCV